MDAATGLIYISNGQYYGSLQASINARPFGSDIPKEFPVLFYTLDIVLMLIMVFMLIAVAFLSVRERTRDFGILKTIGLTPKQIASSIVSTHAVLAIIASALSVPLGIALYYALYALTTGATDDPAQLAPWWWLALIPGGATLLAHLPQSFPHEWLRRAHRLRRFVMNKKAMQNYYSISNMRTNNRWVIALWINTVYNISII